MNHWTLTPGADLACHFWGDECVVHHALSNDTHRLAAWAGQLLLSLEEAGATSSEHLAERLERDPDEVEQALAALAQLELVTCN